MNSPTELNSSLQQVGHEIRLYENDMNNAPRPEYRDRARAKLTGELYPYRDFLVGLRAAAESNGLIPAGPPENDPYIKTYDRKVRQLKDQRDQIGSDINILRQSIESLGCAGRDRTGMTKQEAEDLRNKENSDRQGEVEDAEAAAARLNASAADAKRVGRDAIALRGKSAYIH